MLACLLALIGGLRLAATRGLNVLFRTREIGVLSWVLGALLCYPLANPLSGGVGMAFLGVWTDYVFSFPGVGLWLLVAVIVSVVASFWPAHRAAKLSVRETLAYEQPPFRLTDPPVTRTRASDCGTDSRRGHQTNLAHYAARDTRVVARKRLSTAHSCRD